MPTNEFDAVAVQQDAASVHALATRAFGEVDMNDPAVALLAAWVAEIDDGGNETRRFVMPTTPSRASPTLASAAPGGRRAALIAGSTVLALVVSGGAAAAVTGDPLAIVRAPIHALGKVNPFADSDTNARERLPQKTPATANANKLVADAQRAMAQGDTAKAQKLIAAAETLMGGGANPGQQNRIDRLNDELAGPTEPDDPKGKGPVDRPSQGSDDPKGKGPVDKAGTEPGGGSSTGGSGKPPKDEAPSKGSSSDSEAKGETGVDKASAPPSTKPTKASKSNTEG
jgi:hypothetical protein